MHVISRKALLEFSRRHPDSAMALRAWYRIMVNSRFGSFGELRRTFPSVDRVGDKYVFNIGGNKVRLIAAIHFNRQKVYVRHVLTHAEYDKEKWE